MGGPDAPVDTDTGQRTQSWLAVSNEPRAMVSGQYWYQQRRQQPASNALDVEYQDSVVAELAALAGVALP
jgi:hypothetical protein